MKDVDPSMGYLYINGLGDGTTKLHNRLVAWWWKRRQIDLQHAHINWFDGQSLDEKIGSVKAQTQQLLQRFGSVVLIGSSAGGSLALNAFHEMSDQNICLVAAHARLKVGDYPDTHRVSLYHRAHMDTDRPSQAFMDSVIRAETHTLPDLSADEKDRTLTLSTLGDLVVPTHLMTIEGVQNHQSHTFSHTGGFLTQFLVDRDIIIDFATDALS
jgi:hypothetical protein